VSGPDLAAASRILRAACGDRLWTDFPLAPLTTFRIGGPAALYLEPDEDADLFAAAEAIRASRIPFVVLGKGSNVLVADEGFPGLVIRLGKGYRWAARHGDELTSGGAMPLPALSGVAIPATLGGAVRMNAGAHGREMADALVTIDVVGLLDGVRETIAAADAGFTYRRSGLGSGAVVVGARLRLEPGTASSIRAAMDQARAWRRQTQPLAEPNCGSVFKNPGEDHAARLIDAAGLKGLSVGSVQVSRKHANFIVAGPGARAADVRRLIEDVRARVREASGIELEPEVQFVGAFAE
jgi:UDP-N-acetylmuramate dehydrogenase